MSDIEENSICTLCDEYQKEIELPCGHKFCLTCISGMEKNKDSKCPLCRRHWKVDSAEEALEGATALDKKKEFKFDEEIPCPEHDKPFIAWCKDCNEFACITCLSAQHMRHYVNDICESVDDIKNSIRERKQFKKNDMEEQMKILEENDQQLMELSRSIGKLIESVKTAYSVRCLYQERLQTIDDFLSDEKINNYASFHKKCSEILTDTPLYELPELMPEMLQDKLKLPNIKPLKSTKSEELPKEVCQKIAYFKSNRKLWIVNDPESAWAASVASESIPNFVMRIECKRGKNSIIPFDHISKAFGNANEKASVVLHFYDSFCGESNNDSDKLILTMCINSKCRLTSYYGSCPNNLETLPITVTELGLAIKSKKHVQKICRVQNWMRLSILKLSVSINFPPDDLSQLKHFNQKLSLYISGEISESLANVYYIIHNLIGGKTLQKLEFLHFEPPRTLFSKFKLEDLNLDGFNICTVNVDPTSLNSKLENSLGQWIRTHVFTGVIRNTFFGNSYKVPAECSFVRSFT